MNSCAKNWLSTCMDVTKPSQRLATNYLKEPRCIYPMLYGDNTISSHVYQWAKLQSDLYAQFGFSTNSHERTTMLDNDQILTDLLRREGGLSDDPDDPGGFTNFGLTTKSLSEYYGRPVGANEVETLTAAVARTIYADMYIEKPGFNLIGVQCIRALLVDSAVNNGRARATKWLQTALGVVPDGVIGPRTAKAMEGMLWADVYYKVLHQRFACYAELPRSNPKLLKFLPGWINRANEFVVKAV